MPANDRPALAPAAANASAAVEGADASGPGRGEQIARAPTSSAAPCPARALACRKRCTRRAVREGPLLLGHVGDRQDELGVPAPRAARSPSTTTSARRGGRARPRRSGPRSSSSTITSTSPRRSPASGASAAREAEQLGAATLAARSRRSARSATPGSGASAPCGTRNAPRSPRRARAAARRRNERLVRRRPGEDTARTPLAREQPAPAARSAASQSVAAQRAAVAAPAAPRRGRRGSSSGSSAGRGRT